MHSRSKHFDMLAVGNHFSPDTDLLIWFAGGEKSRDLAAWGDLLG